MNRICSFDLKKSFKSIFRSEELESIVIGRPSNVSSYLELIKIKKNCCTFAKFIKIKIFLFTFFPEERGLLTV